MRILFVCFANACRSQIAEAYARVRAPEGVTVQSAGLVAGGLWPEVGRALAPWGIGVEGQTSKTLDSLAGERFDLVVSLSDQARRACDRFAAGAERRHWPILDPAGVRGDERDIREAFELTRDDIAAHIDELFEELFEPDRLGPRPARPGSE